MRNASRRRHAPDGCGCAPRPPGVRILLRLPRFVAAPWSASLVSFFFSSLSPSPRSGFGNPRNRWPGLLRSFPALVCQCCPGPVCALEHLQESCSTLQQAYAPTRMRSTHPGSPRCCATDPTHRLAKMASYESCLPSPGLSLDAAELAALASAPNKPARSTPGGYESVRSLPNAARLQPKMRNQHTAAQSRRHRRRQRPCVPSNATRRHATTAGAGAHRVPARARRRRRVRVR
jgi:hypothetical protein